jgi:hypothetical protein
VTEVRLALAGALALALTSCRDRILPSSATAAGPTASTGEAVLTLGDRAFVVHGESSTAVSGKQLRIDGSGHVVRVEEDWIDVDGDRRPLPRAHEVKIDLKPERVMVDADGELLAFVK